MIFEKFMLFRPKFIMMKIVFFEFYPDVCRKKFSAKWNIFPKNVPFFEKKKPKYHYF